MSQQFTFPEHLTMGDRVEYSPDGTSQSRCLAMILEVKASSAMSVDLLLYLPGGSQAFRRDCWHADDPRVESHPEVFTQQENRGVFRLLGDQQYRVEMSNRLQSLERVCRGLVVDVGTLRATMRELQEAAPQNNNKAVSPIGKKKTPRKLQPAGA